MLADIRTLWIGGALSRLEYVCLNSFLKYGHNVYLYTYEKVDNVPDGVKVLPASDILPKSKIFTYGKITGKGKGSFAGFANHFRYEMLLKCENSYWVDMDVICLSPFSLEFELDFGFENDDIINNAIIGSKYKNNKLFESLIQYCNDPFKLKKWDTKKIIVKKIIGRYFGKSDLSYLPWGVTGPRALTGYIKHYKLEQFISKQNIYYPVKADDWNHIFNKQNNVQLIDSKALHLWNEYLRRDGIDKNTIFDEGSVYETLIKDNGLDIGCKQ